MPGAMPSIAAAALTAVTMRRPLAVVARTKGLSGRADRPKRRSIGQRGRNSDMSTSDLIGHRMPPHPTPPACRRDSAAIPPASAAGRCRARPRPARSAKRRRASASPPPRPQHVPALRCSTKPVTPALSAASCSRRLAGVDSVSTSPTTAARARLRSPSSIAQRISRSFGARSSTSRRGIEPGQRQAGCVEIGALQAPQHRPRGRQPRQDAGEKRHRPRHPRRWRRHSRSHAGQPKASPARARPHRSPAAQRAARRLPGRSLPPRRGNGANRPAVPGGAISAASPMFSICSIQL